MVENKTIIPVPEWLVKQLIEQASFATCHRSKCGSLIVVSDTTVIGRGFNAMPNLKQTDCFKDSLPANFKSDKTCCIHAEQNAIIDALKNHSTSIPGSDLYFIRLDENNNPKHSGQPYCTICSKMALEVGISRFILWHKEGWTAYDTKYYNELSFKYNNEK